MKYDKYDRQAIKSLSDSARRLFEVIEREEKGEIVEVSNLCSALERDPNFVLFSCLSGNGKKEELSTDLGALFTTRLGGRVTNLIKLLHQAGYAGDKGFGLFTVIVDDTEPCQVWGWEMSQKQVTDWYSMVIEDICFPFGCEIKLWSSVTKVASMTEQYSDYRTLEGVYKKVEQLRNNSLLLHQLFDHMKKFPNKKLKKETDLRDAALRRLVHYETQGFVLSRVIPNAILIQTETPWDIKDPLYCSGENSLSIIHPFPEGR